MWFGVVQFFPTFEMWGTWYLRVLEISKGVHTPNFSQKHWYLKATQKPWNFSGTCFLTKNLKNAISRELIMIETCCLGKMIGNGHISIQLPYILLLGHQYFSNPNSWKILVMGHKRCFEVEYKCGHCRSFGTNRKSPSWLGLDIWHF